MFYYILRRVLYALPILLGINLITFLLFFVVNSPDDMARIQLGQKYVTPQAIQEWKSQRGYDKPLFYNESADRSQKITNTIFYNKSINLLLFKFGSSDTGRNIGHDIKTRMFPSLAIAAPTLVIGLFVNITFALLLVFFKSGFIDRWGSAFCVVIMSISGLFFIMGGQFIFSKTLQVVPVSGYEDGWILMKFVALPILVGIISGIGAGVRWYRVLFIEELSKQYVLTARAKGLSEYLIFFKHVLKNAMIPILTGVVVIIPSLFFGSLLLESFFAIPGLGSYTIDAIMQQDFAIVRAMVFLGSVLYIVGLLLTDISYTLVDPRVRLA